MRPHRTALRLIAGLATLTLSGGLAARAAQGPVSTQGAVGSALGAPGQARIAAPRAAPTVKPGAGGGAAAGATAAPSAQAAIDAQIDAAIAREGTEDHIQHALDLGASAADLVKWLNNPA